MNHLLFEYSESNSLLFKQLQNGNEKALEAFYTRAYPLFFRYAMYLTENEFEAFSIVQEAVLKAWQMREKIDNIGHLFCFIKLQIRWRCYSFLRVMKTQRRRIYSFDEKPISDALLLCAWNNSTEDISIMMPAQLHAVSSILQTLPTKRKRMLDVYLNGGTIKYIALSFGCSVSKASAEIRSAIQHLRQAIKPVRPIVCLTDNNSTYAHLDNTTQRIIYLRNVAGDSFNDIALKMKLPVLEVLKLYMDVKPRKTA